MFDNLFLSELPILNLVIRAAVVFAAVVALLRLSGKRQMGQLSATEFVVILLISNAVQNSMNGGDNSLAGGIALACTLIAMSIAVSWLSFRSPMFSRILEGTSTQLIRNGKVIRSHMDRERLTDRDLKILLRKHGVHDFHLVEDAILEADGSLSITTRGSEGFRFEEA